MAEGTQPEELLTVSRKSRLIGRRLRGTVSVIGLLQAELEKRR